MVSTERDGFSLRNLRWWFWVESVTAMITGLLGLVTLLWHDWIEVVFKIDPDHGNGSVELWLVAVVLVVAVVSGSAARRTWRAASTASQGQG
jgi:hypothetical protein